MILPKHPQVSTGFAIVALFIMTMTAGIVIYLTLIEKPYLSYPILPVPTLKKSVYPGEILPLKVTRCNKSKSRKSFTSTRFLDNTGDDQEVIVMELVGVTTPPGCVSVVSNAHRIPDSTLPGKYQLTGIASVPGVLRNFSVEWYSEAFEVLAKPGGVTGAKGEPGEKGDTGEKGDSGEKGKVGEKGAPGPPGVAGTSLKKAPP